MDSFLEHACERFFAAAADPSQWPDALGCLGKQLGTGVVSIMNSGDGLHPVALTDQGLAVARTYAAEKQYLRDDRHRRSVAMRGRLHSAFGDQHILTEAEWKSSPMIQEFAIPNKVAWFANCKIGEGPDHIVTLALFRDMKAGRFEDADFRLLDYIAPVLRRAWTLSETLGQQRVHGTLSVLACLNKAAILIDKNSRIIDMNALAEHYLDGPLEASGSRLKCPGNEEAFGLALARASRAGLFDADASPVPFVINCPKRGRIAAEIQPVAGLAPAMASGNSLLVVLRNLDGMPPVRKNVLRMTFDLTVREADAVALLSAGHSQQDIATIRNVGINTVTSQIKSARKKMGAEDLAGLVRIVERLFG